MKKRHQYLLISLICFALCFGVIAYGNAGRAYIILPMQGGSPAIGLLTYHGYVLIEKYKTTGLYMVTGKTAELDALGAMAGATMITKITDVPWAELDAKPVKADADKITAVMATEATGTKPTVTDKDTYREALLKMVMNKQFEKTDWVKDE